MSSRMFEDGERYRTQGGLWVLVTDVFRGKYRATCTVTDRGRSVRGVQIARINNGSTHGYYTESVSFVGADGGYYTVLARHREAE